MDKLLLDISTSSDCTNLVVKDISPYQDATKISNLILEVKGPGQSCFAFFNMTAGFTKTLGCLDMNLCVPGCTPYETKLPDGNYVMRLSYKPNAKTVVEYNHFRNCQQFSKYIAQNCQLFSTRYSMTQKQFDQRVEELFILKEMINSAKYAAEECLDVNRAIRIYDEVNQRLSQYGQCKGC